MPVFPRGSRVTCFGHLATVIHGNDADSWGPASAIVNIRFDRAPRGWSPQIDIDVTSLLPA